MDAAVLRAQQWLNNTYSGKPGYTPITEDGATGQGTVKALTIALQIELGLTSPTGSFGPQTSSLYPTLRKNTGASPSNIVRILQHGLFCKGYNPGGATGIFGDNTEAAVSKVQSDAGLNADGIVTPLIFKTILNTDPLVLTTGGSLRIRSIQQQLNRDYNAYFGIIPTNGKYERNTNKALIYALQAEEGLAVGTANGNFGPATQSSCPTLALNDTRTNFVKILQYALVCNNMSVDNLAGNFNESTRSAIIDFQTFVCLPDNGGVADLDVWMSLLTSKGNTVRAATGCDCATVITDENVSVLTSNGYTTIGRYLTGLYKLTDREIGVLKQNHIRIFPIFQRSGEGASATSVGYFTLARAASDARDAYEAARALGFPQNTIIYFAVDFDAYDYQVTNTLLPFYERLNSAFAAINKMNYRIGIYGPRNVCSRISAAGYAISSFVADMSTGYSGNLGYTMPANWAFDQIVTTTIRDRETGASIEIDKDVVRGTYIGETPEAPEPVGISFEEAVRAALKYTSFIETGTRGYAAIAGNSDDQGLSLGLVQFNIGRGTLQPVLQDILEQERPLVVSIFGEAKTNALEQMLQMPNTNLQNAWVVETINDSNNQILPDWKAAFQELAQTEAFMDIYDKYINTAIIQEKAVPKCNLDDFYLTTCRAFALMFDMSVKHGGFYQIDVKAMRDQFTSGMTDLEKLQIICNVLKKRYGSEERFEVILNGTGTVHKTPFDDLAKDYGITDDVIYDLPPDDNIPMVSLR